MGNTVNRRRGRPRVESVNFRVFFRLVLFEAAARIYLPRTHSNRLGWEARRFWCRGADNVRRQAEQMLRRFDDRRFYA